jgi:hypothetical protein
MTAGVIGLDTDWHFTYLNETGRAVICEAAGETFTVDELVGLNIRELLPEARSTRFEAPYRKAMQTQKQLTFDEYYEPLDVWFEVRAYPSETGLSICFRDVTERRQQHERLAAREAVLREMYDAIADRDASFEERVDNLLRIGQQVLGTSHGTLSNVQGDDYVFEVVRSPGDMQPGDVIDLSVTSCERIVMTEETLVLANVAEDAPDLTEKAGYAEWGVRCYLGTPVIVDDEVYGTFCFYDTEPRTEPFSDWAVTLVDLMGRWVGVALERKLVEERLRRQNDRLEKFATLALARPPEPAERRWRVARRRPRGLRERGAHEDRGLPRTDGGAHRRRAGAGASGTYRRRPGDSGPPAGGDRRLGAGPDRRRDAYARTRPRSDRPWRQRAARTAVREPVSE